jgi:hypothetical protein
VLKLTGILLYLYGMSKKIKITESQLQILVKQKGITEDVFHINQMGEYESGEGPMPEPYEMAEIVSKQIRLHPDYFKIENNGALEEFLDALREILTINNEEDRYFPDSRQGRDLTISDVQMNEQLEGDQDQRVSKSYDPKIRTFNDILKAVEQDAGIDTSIGELSSVESDDYDEYQDRHMGLYDLDEIGVQDLPVNESIENIKKSFKRFSS